MTLNDLYARFKVIDSLNAAGGSNDLQISFKVIKKIKRKLYDFLLVVYSKFLMTLKYRQGHRQSHHVKAVVWPKSTTLVDPEMTDGNYALSCITHVCFGANH